VSRLLHSWESWFQKSLILEHLALAKALPSLFPLRPSGLWAGLVISGFTKTGCLSHSAGFVGSDLHKPGLTLIQAPRMLFHREHGGRLSLGDEKSQCMSWVLGPMA